VLSWGCERKEERGKLKEERGEREVEREKRENKRERDSLEVTINIRREK
jgi:hypothetical protein